MAATAAAAAAAAAALRLVALGRRTACTAASTTTSATPLLAFCFCSPLSLLLHLLLLGLGLLQPLDQKEELAPIGRVGHPQGLVVHDLQVQEVGGPDDAGGAEVGNDGRGEADALEPLGDDAHC